MNLLRIISLLVSVGLVGWLLANISRAAPRGLINRLRFVLVHRTQFGELDLARASTRDLIDERARVLTSIDDIINTAGQSGSLGEAERAELDGLERRFDQLSRHLEVVRGDSGGHRGPVDRLLDHGVPSINPSRFSGEEMHRSLDAMLWATDETVVAGGLDRAGNFRPNDYGARNPVEQVMIRSDDGGVNMLAPRITEFHADHRQAVRSFQRTVADMCLFGLLIDPSAKNGRQGFEVARAHRMWQDRWQHVLRALDVDTAAEGGNWVPTGIGAEMHEKVRAMGKIAPLFARIDLPTNPWKWPVEGADAVAYRVGEPTGDTETKVTASTPGTLAATFDAEIFGARTLVSRSLDADSAHAIIPFVRRKLVIAFATAEETAILDGDADGSHQDSDVSGTADARTAWDGLRKRALANAATSAAAALGSSNILTMRGSMGKWGLNPTDLVIIVGTSSYYDILADTNLITVDKFGPHATILNGQIGAIWGAPIVVSEHVRENLNASGVYDGITTTKTYALAVNRNEWVMGQRMALDIEVDDSPYRETFQRLVVGFMREDFQNIGDAASNDDTAILYNVTP